MHTSSLDWGMPGTGSSEQSDFNFFVSGIMSKENGMIYDTGDTPPFKENLFGAFQQFLAISAATILVPLIVDPSGHYLNMASALIGAGFGTIVYLLFTKFRSPVFLGSSFAFLGSMFSGPLTDSFGRYCLSGSWLVLLVSGIGCFPFPRIIAQNLFHSQSPAVMVVNLAFFGILVYFCVAGMLSDTYASFLYFQF